MAERRMFAKTIIDSDAFLDMPLSTQALYFHLSMRADDDGFINNPKKIQRMIGASDDDLKLLIAKNFIIPFESGIVVIKHWRIHNYIQKDRYKPTVYAEEKKLLDVKENNSYTLDTNCIQNGYILETQDRLGKDSLELGKDSLELNTLVENEPSEDAKTVFDLFNEICVSLPKARDFTKKRKDAIRKLLKEYTIGDIETVFEKAEASDFLKGKKSDWKCNFDWLMNINNFVKVKDGNYDNKRAETFAERLARA